MFYFHQALKFDEHIFLKWVGSTTNYSYLLPFSQEIGPIHATVVTFVGKLKDCFFLMDRNWIRGT